MSSSFTKKLSFSGQISLGLVRIEAPRTLYHFSHSSYFTSILIRLCLIRHLVLFPRRSFDGPGGLCSSGRLEATFSFPLSFFFGTSFYFPRKGLDRPGGLYSFGRLKPTSSFPNLFSVAFCWSKFKSTRILRTYERSI